MTSRRGFTSGLVASLSAPRARQPQPGITPGSTPAIVVAREVIVIGPGGKIVINPTTPEIDIISPTGVTIGIIKGLLVSPTGLILQGSGSVSLQTSGGTSKIFVGTAVSPNVIVIQGPVGAITAGAPSSPGTVETWHNMTLLNSWANVAAFAVAQYRKVASPPNSVEIIGAINAAAATAATFATLPAGYIPASSQPVCSMGANAAVPAGLSPWINCDTSGNLSVQNTGGVPAAWRSFFHGFIALDA